MKKKIWGPNLAQRGLSHSRNQVFCHFLKFGSLVFLQIALNYSVQQYMTSSRGRTQKKKFGDQIWAKTGQNWPQNQVFGHFLKFGSLVFLEIEYNDSLQQCMTSSRGKTHKKFGGTKFGSKRPKSGPNLGFLPFFKFDSSVLLEVAYTDSLQQCLASIRGKTYERKIWGDQIQAKIRLKINGFFAFFSRLVH